MTTVRLFEWLAMGALLMIGCTLTRMERRRGEQDRRLDLIQLNNINSQVLLRYVIERIASHPINRIEEPLPWAIAARPSPLAQAA